MKLQKKLLIIFLLITILPMMIFTYIMYSRFSILLNHQSQTVTENLIDRAVEETNTRLESLERIRASVSFDATKQGSVMEELHKYIEGESPTSYDVYESNLLMQTIFQSLFQTEDYLNGIYIFTPSGEIIGCSKDIDFDCTYDPSGDVWYQQAIELHGSTYVSELSQKEFLFHAEESISFVTALYDMFTDEFLGVLFVDCSPEVFDLSRINTMPETTCLQICRGADPEKQNFESTILYSTGMDAASAETDRQLETTEVVLDIPLLKLVCQEDFQTLKKSENVTLYLIIAVALVCILVYVVLAVVISRWISQPISRLSGYMAKHDTSLSVQESPYMERTDEIGILYREYETMIKELDRYIKNELQNKLLTLNSQMRSLEAQINAHFLYNTLEAISSLAAIEEVPEISTMAEALSAMFRYSIKTKSELVTFSQELDHVKNYVAIQQIRFDQGFQVIYDIPEEILQMNVLKLILQPLVENALYHGLESCSSGDEIRIVAGRRGNLLEIKVMDNGIGMSPEILMSLQDSLKEQVNFSELGFGKNQSIGVKNIHVRIMLYYGETYGISIESTEGEGSTFIIRLPVTQ